MLEQREAATVVCVCRHFQKFTRELHCAHVTLPVNVINSQLMITAIFNPSLSTTVLSKTYYFSYF